jgi:predicted RNA-binding protein with PIN domain
MPYIIDGHNLIGKLPNISLREIDDEIQLIEILQDFCHRQNKTVEVYFDSAPAGTPRARKYGSVTAYFVRSGKTADQAIMERLKALDKAARNWTVVSSDHQVQKAAQASRASILTSEAFIALLTSPSPSHNSIPEKPDQPLSESEVEDWLKVFHPKNK